MMHAPDRAAFTNGRFFTSDIARPWVQALLVEGGRIRALGSTAEVLDSAGREAVVVDLEGRMAMPGIHDAHTHLLMSGLKFRYECRLPPDAAADQIVNALCDCERCRRGKLSGWLIGGEYNANRFPPAGLDRAFLDERFPDTAVYLYDMSIHHGFANSRALALAGITADTPDPRGGRIVRRNGSREPTGELVERATWQVKRAIPAYEPDIYRAAVKWAIQTAHRFGITSVQEASATLPALKVFNALDAENALNLHIAAHLVWREESFGGASQDEMDALIGARGRYSSPHVNTQFVKCWMDGAPLPPHFTHSSLDPGTGQPDHNLVISEAELTDALCVFDRQGLSMKIHCAAEGSVRAALNAVTAVRGINGGGGPRHDIAHALFVHPDDIGRFAPLNVGAEMSPALWHVRTPELAALDRGCRFETLRRAGASVTIGSDWIVTETPNLFPALQGMLDRGDESVDLATAVHMMTLAGARAVGLDANTGSLEIGKLADFIVLDRNLFDVPVDRVGDTEVLRTVFEGRTVYQKL